MRESGGKTVELLMGLVMEWEWLKRDSTPTRAAVAELALQAALTEIVEERDQYRAALEEIRKATMLWDVERIARKALE